MSVESIELLGEHTFDHWMSNKEMHKRTQIVPILVPL